MLAARRPGQLNVILHPRSRGSAREWGLANFGQLARLLHQAGHRVLITGTAAEGEELADWLREHAAFLAADLTGQLRLPQFIAFIAAADGLVAGSTGPLHLAAALGRHALGLYPPIRPMHPGRWAPLGPHAESLVFDRPDCQDCRAQPRRLHLHSGHRADGRGGAGAGLGAAARRVNSGPGLAVNTALFG